jgi:uroporphyrinogen-III decarboxylase
MPLAQDFADSGMDMMTTFTPPPSGDVDAEQIKNIMKNKVVLSGYVDTIKIRYGTPVDIEAQTKYACEVLGKDGGFILGTSDSIRDGSPKINVDTYFNAAAKYSKY